VSWDFSTHDLHTDEDVGVTIRYEVHGDGPPVMLLHGFSSSFRRNWHGVGWTQAFVEAGRKVIGPDLRGHGKSSKFHTYDAYWPSKLCHDIVALQDAEEALPMDLLGFSMGGGLALQYAMLYPARVRRLVLAGIGDKVLRTKNIPMLPSTIAQALETDHPESIESPIGRQFRSFATKTNNDLLALAAMMRGPGWPGRVDELRPLTVSTRVILAEHDTFMPETQLLRESSNGSRLSFLARARHGQSERPFPQSKRDWFLDH
jgi:pimeloyl-ACP methyl ester carboxylesterase